MKRILSLVAAAVCALGLVSCECEDIGWTPDTVVTQLMGYVHFEVRTPVANATIDVVIGGQTYTVTTDANGYYLIEQIEAGKGTAAVSYTVDPNIKGYTKVVTLEESKVNECNFLLIKAQSHMEHEGDLYKVWLPDVIQEDKSISQIATFYMPYGTMAEGDDLDLQAYYDVEPYEENVSKADDIITIPMVDSEGYTYTGMDVIITVTSKSKLGKTHAEKPFLIEIQELMHPISVIHNEKSVAYSTDTERKVSYFWTNEYGISKFRYPIYLKEKKDQRLPLVFDPSEFASSGKLYTTVKATFERRWGIEVDWEVQTPSFLWQYVKIILGGDWYTTITDTYYNPFVRIPKGEIIVLTGYQTYIEYDFKCEWAHVYVKIYDGYKVELTDRKHTGGSN